MPSDGLLCRWLGWLALAGALGRRLGWGAEKAVAYALFGLGAVAGIFAGIEFGRHDEDLLESSGFILRCYRGGVPKKESIYRRGRG